MYQFEVCANSVESCVAAQEGGAQRVELCAGIPEGGTTPSYGEIRQARRLLTACRLHVIIRPRGGDFFYSPMELERMADDIRMCRQLGADGVVFGCLDEQGRVDEAVCRLLLQECEGLSVTFHRAFDRATNPEEALETIIRLGFHRLLTSGQAPTAAEGVALLRRLQAQAAGRIGIMAGCGVTEQNISDIARATDISQFHFSARVPIPSKALQNEHVYMGTAGQDESLRMVTSAQRVSQTIAAIMENL